jgi:hypothetical protein
VSPVKAGTTTMFGYQAVLRRPRLAALLGAIASEWSLMEETVADFYAYLLGLSIPRAVQPLGTLRSWPMEIAGYAIFQSIIDTNRRIILLKQLAALRIHDGGVLEEVDVVMTLFRRAATKRNEFLHGTWGVSDDYPNHLIRTPHVPLKNEKPQPFGERQFMDALEQIEFARVRLAQFAGQVTRILEPMLEPK